MPIAVVIERSQKSVGSSRGRFGGPDRYVSVVVGPAPWPTTRPLVASRIHAEGYELHGFGEGYSKSTGPRSALSIARKEAAEFAARINAGGAA